MKINRIVSVAAAAIVAVTLFASPIARAQDAEEETWKMLRDNRQKNPMITKERFMKMMERRWSQYDKEKKGEMTAERVRQALDPNHGAP